MSRANNPRLKSWLDIPPNSDFPIQNLPFGIFKTADRNPGVGVAIGEYILDLRAIAKAGLLDEIAFDKSSFEKDALNDFIALGKKITNEVRAMVSDFLNSDNPEFGYNTELRAKAASKNERCSNASFYQFMFLITPISIQARSMLPM